MKNSAIVIIVLVSVFLFSAIAVGLINNNMSFEGKGITGFFTFEKGIDTGGQVRTPYFANKAPSTLGSTASKTKSLTAVKAKRIITPSYNKYKSLSTSNPSKVKVVKSKAAKTVSLSRFQRKTDVPESNSRSTISKLLNLDKADIEEPVKKAKASSSSYTQNVKKVCTPNCKTKYGQEAQCGDDGCGKPCGQCSLWQKCVGQECISKIVANTPNRYVEQEEAEEFDKKQSLAALILERISGVDLVNDDVFTDGSDSEDPKEAFKEYVQEKKEEGYKMGLLDDADMCDDENAVWNGENCVITMHYEASGSYSAVHYATAYDPDTAYVAPNPIGGEGCLFNLPPGGTFSVFAHDGTLVTEGEVNDEGQAVADLSRFPNGELLANQMLTLVGVNSEKQVTKNSGIQYFDNADSVSSCSTEPTWDDIHNGVSVGIKSVLPTPSGSFLTNSMTCDGDDYVGLVWNGVYEYNVIEDCKANGKVCNALKGCVSSNDYITATPYNSKICVYEPVNFGSDELVWKSAIVEDSRHYPGATETRTLGACLHCCNLVTGECINDKASCDRYTPPETVVIEEEIPITVIPEGPVEFNPIFPSSTYSVAIVENPVVGDTFRIVDLAGNILIEGIVKEGDIFNPDGSLSYIKIDMTEFAEGGYIISYARDDESVTEKIFKQDFDDSGNPSVSLDFVYDCLEAGPNSFKLQTFQMVYDPVTQQSKKTETGELINCLYGCDTSQGTCLPGCEVTLYTCQEYTSDGIAKEPVYFGCDSTSKIKRAKCDSDRKCEPISEDCPSGNVCEMQDHFPAGRCVVNENLRAYYRDNDDDGYGTIVTQNAESKPDGYAEMSGDCDDSDDTIHPGVTVDNCDGKDNNCNGQTDEGAVFINPETGKGTCNGHGGPLSDICNNQNGLFKVFKVGCYFGKCQKVSEEDCGFGVPCVLGACGDPVIMPSFPMNVDSSPEGTGSLNTNNVVQDLPETVAVVEDDITHESVVKFGKFLITNEYINGVYSSRSIQRCTGNICNLDVMRS
jgi:hypothetical protein